MKHSRTLLSLLYFFLLLSFSGPLTAARIPWQLDDSYSGPNRDVYTELRWKIPNMIRQLTIDVSVRLGLPYEEDWRYPLTVKFSDSSPIGTENVLAYVQLYSGAEGIKQDLVINLSAYKEQNFDFEKVFTHELVHAMMNDAVGASALRYFPVWLHEGLAVYGAQQGEKMARVYVYQFSGFAESRLLNGLDGAQTALDYAENYWAIKYINDQHGPNAIGSFIRELIEREGRVRESYEYAVGEDYEDFLKNARKFSVNEIKNIGTAERGKQENPY